MVFRVKAFLLHLIISISLALLALGIVFGVWYPRPLHKLLGVTDIFLIILLVDVTLGPLLTLIVSSPGKKSLKFDLSVIICLQLFAFGYGFYTVAEGRPVWLVFTGDRFEIAQAYELEGKHLEEAPSAFAHIPLFGPEWVGAEQPEDANLRNELLFSALAGGPDLAQRPDLYKTYESVRGKIRENALPLSNLAKVNEQQLVQNILGDWPKADAYLPLTNHRGNLTVLVKRDTAEVIAIVELSP